MMNVFVREIPFIELFLVFSMLSLGGVGLFSLFRRRNPADPIRYASAGKWILGGLIGLAILAITILLAASLFSG